MSCRLSRLGATSACIHPQANSPAIDPKSPAKSPNVVFAHAELRSWADWHTCRGNSAKTQEETAEPFLLFLLFIQDFQLQRPSTIAVSNYPQSCYDNMPGIAPLSDFSDSFANLCAESIVSRVFAQRETGLFGQASLDPD